MSQSLIRLESELTIRNIQPIHQHITEQLSQAEILQVDASQLTRIDTSGAQLLYFLSQYCYSHHHAIEWTPPGEEVFSTLMELGIDAARIFVPSKENINR